MRYLLQGWKLFCYSIGTAACLFVALQLWFLLHVVYWKYANPSSTRFQDTRMAELVEKNPRARLQRIWVPYDRISTYLKRAVIVAEDAKFADHEGFDLEGIEKAIERNKRRGHLLAGGSTISQQLAKNLFLSGERTYARKAQEALITIMLETVMDKERIFELYLNEAEWGDGGLFGCEAASRHYFGVSAAALTAEQAARLAAMLPRPRFYDRNRATPYLDSYSARILARMTAAQLP